MAAAEKKSACHRRGGFHPFASPIPPPHPFRASQFSFARYSPHVCRARWVEVVDERCEQGQGRPGRRRCGERAGNGESSRSERSTRPRWPCCSRSAAAAAATALIRGGARQALAAAECRASSFSWRSGHGWLVPLDARGVRPRARMRAYQGRRRRGRRRPTTTVTNVHEGALVLDVLVLESTLYSTTAAPAPPPSSFQACEQECLLLFAGARGGQGCCLLPLQAQRKKNEKPLQRSEETPKKK